MVYVTVTAVLLRVGWAGHVVLKGETRNAYTILVGKPERNRSLGRTSEGIII
jgi:hypothetical protein